VHLPVVRRDAFCHFATKKHERVDARTWRHLCFGCHPEAFVYSATRHAVFTRVCTVISVRVMSRLGSPGDVHPAKNSTASRGPTHTQWHSSPREPHGQPSVADEPSVRFNYDDRLPPRHCAARATRGLQYGRGLHVS
jgi:hypothetical protein